MDDLAVLPSDSLNKPPPSLLIAFEVHQYRLFRHERLEVHPSVTVLVGLNDVGKSTLLEALHVYGLITHSEGFRGPLADREFAGQGEHATRFVAEWRDADGKLWKHSLTLDASSPEERLSSEGRFWKWNPRTRRLDTEQGTYDAKDLGRYRSLAQVGDHWRLDTEIPPAIFEPLGVLRSFRTPEAYLFEPSSLARPAPISMTRPGRNGFGWGNWLQDVINRRNEDIDTLERDVRQLFPFFDSVTVREQRFQIQREERELGSGKADEPKTEVAGSIGRNQESGPVPEIIKIPHHFSDVWSTREVIVSVHTDEDAPSVRVPASRASSGLLLASSHLALLHATPEGELVLLEEPENGLNGELTLEMIRAFLAVVKRRKQQLVLTTHHPFWLDLVEPESVRLLTRNAEGAHIRTVAGEIRRARENDVYASEIMGAYGPEGLLHVKDRSGR